MTKNEELALLEARVAALRTSLVHQEAERDGFTRRADIVAVGSAGGDPMRIEFVPVGKIRHSEDRRRYARGDVDALASNIGEFGLLHPICVDRYYTLIFGERRLLACYALLHWETIPAVVLDLESLLAGKYGENEVRRLFRVSDRTNIARAIEKELAVKERRGNPQSFASAENWTADKNLDLAAKRAGFANAETLERATVVVKRGAPETVIAMDTGGVSIEDAASIASQAYSEQRSILAMSKDQQRVAVDQIRKAKLDREAYRREHAHTTVRVSIRDLPNEEDREIAATLEARGLEEKTVRALAYALKLKQYDPESYLATLDPNPTSLMMAVQLLEYEPIGGW